MLQDYQRGRIIQSCSRPQCAVGDTYNVNQARIAIGSGG
jgi:cell division protein FtsW (lipid II flippase)